MLHLLDPHAVAAAEDSRAHFVAAYIVTDLHALMRVVTVLHALMRVVTVLHALRHCSCSLCFGLH